MPTKKEKNFSVKNLTVILLLLFLASCSSETDFSDTPVEDDSVVEDTENPSGEEPSENDETEKDTNPTFNPNANVINSSDLGWMAGEDISDKFREFVASAKADDVLYLDHFYILQGGGIQLPDNFTLAGNANGSGFDRPDTGSNQNPILELGNNTVLTDIKITHSNAPDTGTTAINTENGVDFHLSRTIAIQNKSNAIIRNCSIEGDVSIFIDLMGSTNTLIENCHFKGGAIPVRFLGGVSGPHIKNTIFEGAIADGIKSVKGSDSGTQNALVENCVFINCNRDGIDTTGGFKDSTVKNSYFVKNGVSGLDLKTGIDSQENLNTNLMNKNITLNDNEFIDNNNAVVMTTLNREGVLTNANWNEWAVQEIYMNDNIVETHFGDVRRILLIKDSHTVSYKNTQLLGNIDEYRYVNNYPGIESNYGVAGENTTNGDARPEKPDSYYLGLAGNTDSALY